LGANLDARLGTIDANLAALAAQMAALAPLPAQVAALAPLPAQVAALAAQVAPLQAQVAPLQAQVAALAAQVAPLPAQVAALTAQVAALPTLAQLMAALHPPALVAALTRTVQDIAGARLRNAHDRSGEAYSMVPLNTGAPPINWPPGFDRDMLLGAIGPIDLLLAEYGLPSGVAAGAVLARRNALARCIGTMLI